jgi:hypothetical protein
MVGFPVLPRLFYFEDLDLARAAEESSVYNSLARLVHSRMAVSRASMVGDLASRGCFQAAAIPPLPSTS